MAAGGPGDDPIVDIVHYRLPVFSPEVDLLVAEIVALGGEREIRDRYGAFYWERPSSFQELHGLRPFPDDLAADLRVIRDRRSTEARQSGWEVDRLLAEAREGRGEAT
jgi:hypothetical protein